MDFKILENYIESPLKIYDGCEANHIFFKLKNEKGKIVSRLDLWNFHTSQEYTLIENGSELKEINAVFNFPIEKDFGYEGSNSIIFNLDNDRNALVYFLKYKKNEEYVIAFILIEKSPSRYQCFILAVLVVVDGKNENPDNSSK